MARVFPDIQAELRRACEEAGGQMAFAARHGISQGHVSQVLHGHRRAGRQLLGLLGLVLVADWAHRHPEASGKRPE